MQIVSSVFATIPTEGVTALFTVSIILLEVTESGVFKGLAEVDDADIAGRFEGELIVHGRLRVRGTGHPFFVIWRVHGTGRLGKPCIQDRYAASPITRWLGTPQERIQRIG